MSSGRAAVVHCPDLTLALSVPASGTAPALEFARWHADDPCPVINAIMRANEAAPHLAGLARFLLPRLTSWQLASSTIKESAGDDRPFSTYFPLEQAVQQQWWSPATRRWTNTIAVDIDEAGWRPRLARLIRRGLPRPAYVVISPWKGTAHLVWILAEPLDNRDPGEARLRAGIRRGLNLELGGDPRFSNRLTKCPWHVAATSIEPTPDTPCGDPETWAAYLARGAQLTYHTEIGDLRAVTAAELLEPLLALAEERDEWLLSPRPRLNPAGAMWAPAAVSIPGVKTGQDPAKAFFGACADAVRRARTGREDAIRGIVDRTAAAWGFTVTEASREEMTGSIAAWMNTKWTGPLDGKPGTDLAVGRRQVDVGVMKGEAADSGPEALAEWCASTWTERRQAAGRRSASRIQEGHHRALVQARADLVAEGVRPTQTAIAARAGVSLSTAKRHCQHLDVRPPAPPVVGVTRSNLSLGSPVGGVPLAEPLVPKIDSSLALPSDDIAVASYAAVADRMKRRGADPEAVLPLPPQPSPVLQVAYRAALVARGGARRRQEARERKEATLVRAAARADWHVEHVGDDAAWQGRLADIVEAEAKAIQRILDSGGAPRALNRTRMSFGSIRAAEDRAMRRALGKPEPVKRKRLTKAETDAMMEEIPW